MAASSALPTAQIVIEILEQLIKYTDPEHGLTAAEISKRINVSDKTVRGHLKALQSMTPFDRHVSHLDRRDLVNAESANPRPGWYIEPVFDIAQMRLLVDGAALSSSDGEYLRELIAKIYVRRQIRPIARPRTTHHAQELQYGVPQQHRDSERCHRIRARDPVPVLHVRRQRQSVPAVTATATSRHIWRTPTT